jgi:tetratricopeptide (TPR) repeat protein
MKELMAKTEHFIRPDTLLSAYSSGSASGGAGPLVRIELDNLMRAALAAAFVLLLASCHRDLDTAKKALVARGDSYFKRGQYKQASVLYRLALQKDKRYSLAYYKLALTDLKLEEIQNSVDNLRRAVELLPDGSAESDDAKGKLSDIYLSLTREQRYMDEVDGFAHEFLQRDPNSFAGHRLTGDLLFVEAQKAQSSTHAQETKKLLASAIEEYRKANAAKPGQANAIASLARSLALTGEYKEAEARYREALAADRNLAVAYAELNQVYMAQNRVADAEALLKSAVANNPKELKYLTMLAAHYYQQNQRPRMAGVLDEIDSRAKEIPTAYETSGDFYLRVGDGDEAMRRYKMGLKADPEREIVYQKRIIEVLMRQGKKTAAADLNDQILKKTPKDTDARSLRASLLLDQGEILKSSEELEDLVADTPGNYVTRYNLGRAHAAQGDYEGARREFTKVLALKRDYIPARLAFAQLQLGHRDYEDAWRMASDVLRLDKTNTEAALVQSAALWAVKRYREADEGLRNLANAHPDSAAVLFQIGSAYLGRKEFRLAEEMFRKMHHVDSADPRGLIGVIEIYMAENKPDKAIETLQSELQQHPGRMDYRMVLGNIAERAGKQDLAISEYRTVAAGVDEHSKAGATVFLRLGEIYRLKGDLSSAIAALNKALVAQPEDPQILGALAQALDSSGHKKEARQDYEHCLRLNPKNAMALNNLAFLLAENHGDLDQALTYAQRARQLLPHFPDVSDTLGQIYLKKQLTDSALDTFKEIVALQPARAIYRYHLGQAYAQKGEKEKAIQELRLALKSNPQKDEETQIRQLLQKL